jgi:GntR family transcriptional regulator
MTLNKSSHIPLWEQLHQIMIEKILGEWEPGDKIPSENELSKEYELSRMTVRAVLTRLVEHGLLYRVPGKGTFVAEKKNIITPLPFMGIREQLEDQGVQINTVVLRNEPVKLTERVANILGVPVGSEVHLVERLRYIGDETLSAHRSYLKIDGTFLTNNTDRLVSDQLCVILEDSYKIRPTMIKETLESVYATTKLSKKLEVSDTYPLLYLKDYKYLNGEIFEYAEVYIKADKIKLSFEYNIESR